MAAFEFLFDFLVVDLPTHIAQLASGIAQSPQLLIAALGGAVSGLGAFAGLGGLAGLSGVPTATTVLAPAPAAPSCFRPSAWPRPP
ncbi:hypothetical protein ABDZ15_15615 [Mycobacterium canetti]